jgi:hypothetical protein
MFCPNKNSKEYQDFIKFKGSEAAAYNAWYDFNKDILNGIKPGEPGLPEFTLKETSIKPEVSDSEKTFVKANISTNLEQSDLKSTTKLIGKRNFTAKEALKILKSKNKGEILLIDKLLEFVDNNNVNIEVVDELTYVDSEGTTRDANGIYYPESNTIKIKELIDNPTRTITHEIIHGFTLYFVENNPNNESVKKLKLILDKLRREFDIKDNSNQLLFTKDYYPLTNVDELITGVFTNSDFIKNVLGDRQGFMSIKTNPKWREIWDQIANFLGINKEKTPTLYQQLVDLAADVVELQAVNTEINNSIAEKNAEKERNLEYGSYELEPSELGDLSEDSNLFEAAFKAQTAELKNIYKVFNSDYQTKVTDSLDSDLNKSLIGSQVYNLIEKALSGSLNNSHILENKLGFMSLMDTTSPYFQEIVYKKSTYSGTDDNINKVLSVDNFTESLRWDPLMDGPLTRTNKSAILEFGVKYLAKKAKDAKKEGIEGLLTQLNEANKGVILSGETDSINSTSASPTFIPSISDFNAPNFKDNNQVELDRVGKEKVDLKAPNRQLTINFVEENMQDLTFLGPDAVNFIAEKIEDGSYNLNCSI